MYLAYRNIREKWTMPLANWSQTSQQLAIKFGERFEIMQLCLGRKVPHLAGTIKKSCHPNEVKYEGLES